MNLFGVYRFMKEITVTKGQESQRLDKYLQRILPQTTKSFLYKMLRKKNILLNQSKAQGNELLTAGDKITLYFSDETYHKFTGGESQSSQDTVTVREATAAYTTLGQITVLWEDKDVLILNKPIGILSQKSLPTDQSLNEWLIGYLLDETSTATTHITPDSLTAFRPSICNRLDRNTPGILLCGKTLTGSRELSRLLRDKNLAKYYQALVLGTITHPQDLTAHLTKDPKTNKVTIQNQHQSQSFNQLSINQSSISKPSANQPQFYHQASPEQTTNRPDKQPSLQQTCDVPPIPTENCIHPSFRPLKHLTDPHTHTPYTLLEVQLHTGKPHQIRAHLASISHPIIGDPKYGSHTQNTYFHQQAHLLSQFLYACRLEFPTLEDTLIPLSHQTITAPMPQPFQTALNILVET
jgi:23S rRNA pseudouridine955/2504/2580 synthase